MQTKPINLGIVGVGKIVQDQHLPSIRSNSDFHLIATASRNGMLAGVSAYKTIEAMVAADRAGDTRGGLDGKNLGHLCSPYR